MPRVKRGVNATKRRERLLKHAKGFKWGRKNKERAAREALMKAWSYAFRDRRAKKRNFRMLWNIQINAAVRPEGLSYSRLIEALKKHNVGLDRKVLALIAQEEPQAFKALIKEIK